MQRPITDPARAAVNIRIPTTLKDAFDKLARETGRSQTHLMTEALERYAAYERWFLDAVAVGVRQAEAGEFVPDDEMETFWEEIITPEGLERLRDERRDAQ